MSILDWLRTARPETAADQADTDTVLRIVKELDKLEPRLGRYLAAFAYVLSRVAGADRHFSEAETTTMIDLIVELGHLPRAQAILVVEIAKSQNKRFAGTEDYLVTREFREIASDEERGALLDCLFAVAAADAAISPEEEAQIRQISSELGFAHADYVNVRLRYSDKRTVLRKDP